MGPIRHATAIRVKNCFHPLAKFSVELNRSGGSLNPVKLYARSHFAAQQAEKHDHAVF